MLSVPDLHNWTATLPADILRRILHRTHPRRYHEGEALYVPGEAGTGLFQLVSGNVRVCNYSVDGREFVLGILRPGDWVGDLSVLDQLPRTNHAIAQQPVVARWLPKADFDSLYQSYVEIPKALNRMLAHRLRMAFSALEDISSLSLKHRLARYLEQLALADGQCAAGPQLLVINQEQLARLLGAARPSVTRALKHLESEGWLQVRYGGVLLHDLPGLMDTYDSAMGHESLVPSYL